MTLRKWRIRMREAIGRWSPMYLLFCAERDTVADLRFEVARLTLERDRARALAVKLQDELDTEWAEGDAFLRSLGSGDDGGHGAWLYGEDGTAS